MNGYGFPDGGRTQPDLRAQTHWHPGTRPGPGGEPWQPEKKEKILFFENTTSPCENQVAGDSDGGRSFAKFGFGT